jgi:hypothetical protein
MTKWQWIVCAHESDGIQMEGVSVLFFSREEQRPHIHAIYPDGEAKFWLEPAVDLARNYGLSQTQITELNRIVEEKRNDILDAWRKHFAG